MRSLSPDNPSSPRPPRCPKAYLYPGITQHTTDQIEHLMEEARHHVEPEARYRIERAYGVYMGWRTLVMEHAEPGQFAWDDRRLEALLRPAT